MGRWVKGSRPAPNRAPSAGGLERQEPVGPRGCCAQPPGAARDWRGCVKAWLSGPGGGGAGVEVAVAAPGNRKDSSPPSFLRALYLKIPF